MAVFVLDKKKRPLMPCTEKRLLLQRGRAVVVRRHPFTIRSKDRIGGDTQALRLQLDPGSQTTGIALVRDAERVDADTGEVRHEGHVLRLRELNHRGAQIREALATRRAFRCRRRTQNLRYRAPRFTHRGQVAVCASGYFNIQSTQDVEQGISHRHCCVVQRADGSGYGIHPTVTEAARRVA